MITIAVLRETVHGLDERELDDWIARRWVRPEESAEGYRFEDIDVARVQLIRTLRHEMQIDPGAMPVILSLLDQLHTLRRQIQSWQASAKDGSRSP